jgi:hypothetical protein
MRRAHYKAYRADRDCYGIYDQWNRRWAGQFHYGRMRRIRAARDAARMNARSGGPR